MGKKIQVKRASETMFENRNSKNPLFVHVDYQETRKTFNTSASQIFHDLGKEFEWFREVEMSGAKLCELIMCNILKRMKEKK